MHERNLAEADLAKIAWLLWPVVMVCDANFKFELNLHCCLTSHTVLCAAVVNSYARHRPWGHVWPKPCVPMLLDCNDDHSQLLLVKHFFSKFLQVYRWATMLPRGLSVHMQRLAFASMAYVEEHVTAYGYNYVHAYCEWCLQVLQFPCFMMQVTYDNK